MTIHPFPKGQGEEPEQKKRKLPEFVIIDDRQEQFHFEGEVPPPEKERKGPPHIPFRVRIFCLIASMATLVWVLLALLFTLLFLTLSLLTFRKVAPLNGVTTLYWGWTKGAFIISHGLLIAVFNATLGIVFILCYFSQVKENWEKSAFGRILYPHMRRYM